MLQSGFIHSVPVVTHREVVPPRARLVRLGELRRQFGKEKKAFYSLEESNIFNFSYSSVPNLLSVTIQVWTPAFELTDSTHG